MPIDPGRDWLAAGITGLQRQREWDAVATSEGDGTPGDEIAFVALADATFVLESGAADPAPFAEAVGVARLDPDPRGRDLELSWNGSELALTIDGLPADPSGASALERVAAERVSGAYAAHAHRLRGDLWELSVLAL